MLNCLQIKLSCRNVWKVYGDNSDGFSNNSYAQEDPSILSKKITEQGHIVANANVSFDVHIGEIFVIMDYLDQVNQQLFVVFSFN